MWNICVNAVDALALFRLGNLYYVINTKGNAMKKLLLVLIACFAFASAAFAATVNLNTASQAELDTLNGVGPVKAKAIIDYRTKNGPFKSVDDLEKVSGFGKKTVDKLRADLTVNGGAAPAKMESKAKKEAAPAKKDSKSGKKEDDKKGAAAK